jgi:hypothetical protein
MIDLIRGQFNQIKQPRQLAPRADLITMTDCLMSGFAMFSLKFPSLLKFDEGKEDRTIKHNLRTLYGIRQVPSDTYMRERNDELDPRKIRKAYKKIFSQVQRGKLLEEFSYLDNHYLMASDGTGFFESSTIHCKNCCIKQHNKCRIKISVELSDDLSDYQANTYMLVKQVLCPWEMYYFDNDKKLSTISIAAIPGLEDILVDKRWKALRPDEKIKVKELVAAYHNDHYPEEKMSYYHQMYCAAIVHPDKKIVLPFAPEPVMKTDGSTKNDCERNAAKRLYTDTRREHPHMKLIAVEDAIASNVPHLTDLKNLDIRYIVGVKPADHKFVFDLIKQSECIEYEHHTQDGTRHRYRYINEVQLNKKHFRFRTNFLAYWERDKDGKEQHFSWITDLPITYQNVYQIMRGGRVNWRIENNTFNTLKNQGYHFSHNFGHGYKHLSTVFCMLMMLAFFVDQVQELSCYLFKKARARFKSRTSLWEAMRSLFRQFFIQSWDDLFNGIAHGYNNAVLVPNTS